MCVRASEHVCVCPFYREKKDVSSLTGGTTAEFRRQINNKSTKVDNTTPNEGRGN